ncbi:hypothetical protein HWV62_5167 [Athelia sp. TMB]|nr:hypothetical protein HWV62_5167 [Athelia sp. TMB]
MPDATFGLLPNVWQPNPAPGPLDVSGYNMAYHFPPGLVPGFYNYPPYPMPMAGAPIGVAGAMPMAPPPMFPYGQTVASGPPVAVAAAREPLPEGEDYGIHARSSRRVRQQELDDARARIRDLEQINLSLVEELEVYRAPARSPTPTRGRSSSRPRQRYRSASPRRSSSPPYTRRRSPTHEAPSRRRPRSPYLGRRIRSVSYSPSPTRSRSYTPMRTRSRSRSPNYERDPTPTSQGRNRTREPATVESRVTSDPPRASGSSLTSTLPLSSRIDRTPPPPYTSEGSRTNRTGHRGVNRPRNVTSRDLHGPWMTFRVDTVNDCKALYRAAERDWQAMLYLDYCNTAFQQPDHRRTEGSQYLIANWNDFLRTHRERRDQLRLEHHVPFRPAGTRSRRRAFPLTSSAFTIPSPSLATTPSASPTPPVPSPTLSVQEPPPSDTTSEDHQMDDGTQDSESDYLPVLTAPTWVEALNRQFEERLAQDRAYVPEPAPPVPHTAASWDEALSQLSPVGREWASSAPEDWPFGVRAFMGWEPVRVTSNLHGNRILPFDDDVRGWSWLDGLAPERTNGDTTRYDQFMRVAIETMAIPSLYTTLCDYLSTAIGDRPIEHFPFETDRLTSIVVVQWIRDHGVWTGSEDMLVMHGYAQQAIDQYSGHNRFLTVEDYLNVHSRAARNADAYFQYPPIAPGLTRDWTTSGEDHLAERRVDPTPDWTTPLPPLSPWFSSPIRSLIPVPHSPPATVNERRPVTPPQPSDDEPLDYGDDTEDEGPTEDDTSTGTTDSVSS